MVHPDQMRHIKRKSWRARPMHVLIDEIERNLDYPQKKYEGKKMREIERSIEENGFDESKPLKVRPHPTKKGKYILVDGYKRYEALRRRSSSGRVRVPIEIVHDDSGQQNQQPQQDGPRRIPGKTVYDGRVRQKEVEKKPWWKRLLPF